MSEITGGDIAAVASELSSESTTSYDASPASDAEYASDDSTSAPVDATALPSEDALDPSEHPASAGPIPFDRHKSALENARTKAREEALQEWREQYGWAEQIDRSHLESWSQTAAQMHADPVGFLQRFSAELQSHPVYGPQLKSYAARTLGQRQAAQQDDLEPQADLMTEDGTPVYSAKRLAEREAWRERQLEKKFSERLAPLQETHAQMQEARQRELIDRASDEFAAQQLAEIKALPHYAEFATEIKAEFAKMPPPNHWEGYGAQLYKAWSKVVLPNLSKRERAQVLAEMNTRGSASTASPSRPSTSSPVPDAQRPMSELIAEEFAARGM